MYVLCLSIINKKVKRRRIENTYDLDLKKAYLKKFQTNPNRIIKSR